MEQVVISRSARTSGAWVFLSVLLIGTGLVAGLRRAGVFGRRISAVVWTLWLVFIFSPASSTQAGADMPIGVGWQNLEFTTYAPNSIQPIADYKVERVFLDHRKMGFFRVKLLPLLVAQGVSVAFADGCPTNGWQQSFQGDWLPKVKHGGVEWRDVSIGSQKAGSPQLHAGSAELTGVVAPVICTFKDAKLTVNGVERQLSRAELRNEGGHPCVVWKTDGGESHMDLFSGEIFSN